MTFKNKFISGAVLASSLVCASLLASFTNAALAAEPTTKAVVIMYHRFGENDFPSTNVTMEQFRAHVE